MGRFIGLWHDDPFGLTGRTPREAASRSPRRTFHCTDCWLWQAYSREPDDENDDAELPTDSETADNGPAARPFIRNQWGNSARNTSGVYIDTVEWERNCLTCGKQTAYCMMLTIDGKTEYAFICNDCFDTRMATEEWERGKLTKKCKWCGVEFSQYTKAQKFCTPSHKAAWYRSRR